MFKRKYILPTLLTSLILLISVVLYQIFTYQPYVPFLNYYSYPTPNNIENMTKLGYLDVTNPASEKSNEITNFLTKVSQRKSAYLEVVEKKDEKLLGIIYYYDNRTHYISKWTLDLVNETVEVAGSFSLHYQLIDNEDKKEVHLTKIDRNNPTIYNEVVGGPTDILYTYFVK